MKCYVRDYKNIGEYPEAFASYFKGMKSCVLDIETTGFDSSRNKIVLIALLTRFDSGYRITQFLAENHFEESKVLEAAIDFIETEKINYFITFNGLRFDLPFLNSRIKYNSLGTNLNHYNFDLYRFISKNTDLRSRLSSLSQKSLEDYYGILSSRQDVISGRESVALFEKYSLTGNSTLEKIILTHNREDVLQLNRLLYRSILDFTDFHKAVSDYGFPVLDGRYTIRPSLNRKESLLKIFGDQLDKPISAAFFPDDDSPFTSIFNSSTGLFEISVPVDKYGDSEYLDCRSIGIEISDDPDYINGYLILNSRTINKVSRLILNKVLKEKILPIG